MRRRPGRRRRERKRPRHGQHATHRLRLYDPSKKSLVGLRRLCSIRQKKQVSGRDPGPVYLSSSSASSSVRSRPLSPTSTTISEVLTEYSTVDRATTATPSSIATTASPSHMFGRRSSIATTTTFAGRDDDVASSFVSSAQELAPEAIRRFVFSDNPFKSTATSGKQTFAEDIAGTFDEEDDALSSRLSPLETARMSHADGGRGGAAESAVEVETLPPDEEAAVLASEFEIVLTESPTFFLFEMTDVMVSKHDPEVDGVRARNSRYDALLRNRVEQSDRYRERSTQTLRSHFDLFAKNKVANTKKTEVSSTGVSCSEWKMYDELRELRERQEREEQEREMQLLSAGAPTVDEDEDAEADDLQDEEEISTAPVSNAPESVVVGRARLGEQDEAFRSLCRMDQFSRSLMTVERMVVQNRYFNRQNEYYVYYDVDLDSDRRKGGDDADSDEEEEEGEFSEEDSETEDTDSDSGDETPDQRAARQSKSAAKSKAPFKTLWKFGCPLTQGLAVNCMCWNKLNSDILAAGYGNVDFHGPSSGAILCWTIKNPLHPERKFVTPNKCATAVDFSASNPNVLAGGFADGTVALYDVRRRDNDPVLSTSKHHSGTVWGLRWARHDFERLCSVGVDGKVNAWSIKKGLDCQELMSLRSVAGPGDGLVARETGGLCMDFCPEDPNLYLIGSEEGAIFKCSCSYNEQVLRTFCGHSGAVYRVTYSPLSRGLFLSCSADWTVRVWDESSTRDNPLESVIEPFANLTTKKTASVTDVAWHPEVNRVFGCVTVNGLVELWDLNTSTLTPRLSRLSDVVYHCLSFVPQNSSCLLVGDSAGEIEILKPVGLFVKQN